MPGFSCTGHCPVAGLQLLEASRCEGRGRPICDRIKIRYGDDVSEQQFRAWKPLDGVPARVFLEAVHEDYEGLRFLLRGEDATGRTLRLVFESPVAMRVTGRHRTRSGSRIAYGSEQYAQERWLSRRRFLSTSSPR